MYFKLYMSSSEKENNMNAIGLSIILLYLGLACTYIGVLLILDSLDSTAIRNRLIAYEIRI